MNNINFVNTPSPDKQQAVYTWYRVTVYIIALLCTLLIAINGYQWYTIKTLSSIPKQLRLIRDETNQAAARSTALKNTQEQLQQQQEKLATAKQFQPALYLRTIAGSIPDDTCLFTVDMHKKGTIQLIGYTQSADSLRHFMKTLNASKKFGNIELSGLQPEHAQHGTLYRFTIVAKTPSHPSLDTNR